MCPCYRLHTQTHPDFFFSFFFQEHRTEIDARAGTFQAFEQFGQQLLVRGHYASPEIQQKLEALDQERTDLEKAWVQRRMMLDQCLELQVAAFSCERDMKDCVLVLTAG